MTAELPWPALLLGANTVVGPVGAPVRERLLEKRHASQPIGAWSCGSVFTNPPHSATRSFTRASSAKPQVQRSATERDALRL